MLKFLLVCDTCKYPTSVIALLPLHVPTYERPGRKKGIKYFWPRVNFVENTLNFACSFVYCVKQCPVFLFFFRWSSFSSGLSYVVVNFLFFISFWFKQINIEEKNGDNYLSAGEVRFQENFLLLHVLLFVHCCKMYLLLFLLYCIQSCYVNTKKLIKLSTH